MIRVFTGTSIEDFAGSYREEVAARLGEPILNRALGGGSFLFPFPDGSSIRTRIDATIAEFASDPGPKHMHIGGPFNDLVGVQLSEVGQLNWAVHHADNALIAAGWTVSAGAILPFHGGGGAVLEGHYQALVDRRQAYNNWATQHFAGRFVDLSWILREARDWLRADSRFFSDGLHPNQYGNKLAGMAFPLSVLSPTV